MKERNSDVAVIGAGVTGLFLTMKLAQLGCRVMLIERESTIASGPSTRNEGWLHGGTYHATSISDRSTAIEVARRCIMGYHEIMHYSPEAIEDIVSPTFAVLRDAGCLEEIISRWNEAGVLYRAVSRDTLKRRIPRLRTDEIAASFEVIDKSLNTRILYKKLLIDCLTHGAEIVTNARIQLHDDNTLTVDSPSERLRVSAKLFAYTAGLATGQLLLSAFGERISFRFWKSHLLLLPRIAHHGVFFLDAGEATVINHGDFSIVGLNEDAALNETISFEPDSTAAEKIIKALRRMFPEIDVQHAETTACVKTDVSSRSTREGSILLPRSLNIAYGEVRPRHFWFLPGKMTEAPVVANVATQVLCERLGDDLTKLDDETTSLQVALRPCDELRRNHLLRGT
jgi:glycerol-3-phosphate dehydrogenase